MYKFKQKTKINWRQSLICNQQIKHKSYTGLCKEHSYNVTHLSCVNSEIMSVLTGMVLYSICF